MVKNENERDSLNDEELNESEEKVEKIEAISSEDQQDEPEAESNPVTEELIEPSDHSLESASPLKDSSTNEVEKNEIKPSRADEREDSPKSEDGPAVPTPVASSDVAKVALDKNQEVESAEEIPLKSEDESIISSPVPSLDDVKVTPDEKQEVESVEKGEAISALKATPEIEQTNDEHIDSEEVPENIKKDEGASDHQSEDKKSVAESSDSSADEDHAEEEVHLDYTNYTKKQMVQVLESLLKEDDFSQVGKILKEIKRPFDKIANTERREAYNKYVEDGGEKDGFEYRPDELDQKFNLAYDKLRERKNQYFNSLEKQKENNLNTKLEILEKIRELVDSEETGTSIKALKDLQEQWKSVGSIASSQVKGLWANYNALLDRFYDQRSIYFELKELDRKKNYDLKIELCEKAEQLSDQDNIREVIKHLNEFHEEFKHIGPVPKDDQEAVWERFKAASDKVYSRRKEYYEKLKDELKINEVAKEALVEKVILFADFNSDRISDWNSKTKEIIGIQKDWEQIGSLPKEKAKEINKKFWSSFKSFFNKKGQFFKKIEEERRVNLKVKQDLVEKAESVKDSDDFRKTSEELKALQKQWKDIGPVPEKFRNEVFLQFKKACDHFFDRRRANSGKMEVEYSDNLKKKQVLCDELEKMAKDEKIDVDRIKAIEKEWGAIGFVPKSNIKTIQSRYSDIIGVITDKIDIPEADKHKMRFSAQFSNINYGPGAEKLIYKKEGALRRQISTLENDINLWKNNMDFFASSKNADKLKEEFQVKIVKATEELNSLKEQLKIINSI